MNCVRPEKQFDIEAIRAAVRAQLPTSNGFPVDDEVLDIAIRETLATVARQNRW